MKEWIDMLDKRNFLCQKKRRKEMKEGKKGGN